MKRFKNYKVDLLIISVTHILKIFWGKKQVRYTSYFSVVDIYRPLGRLLSLVRLEQVSSSGALFMRLLKSHLLD